jgi:hypothetical protein
MNPSINTLSTPDLLRPLLEGMHPPLWKIRTPVYLESFGTPTSRWPWTRLRTRLKTRLLRTSTIGPSTSGDVSVYAPSDRDAESDVVLVLDAILKRSGSTSSTTTQPGFSIVFELCPHDNPLGTWRKTSSAYRKPSTVIGFDKTSATALDSNGTWPIKEIAAATGSTLSSGRSWDEGDTGSTWMQRRMGS